MSRKDKIMRYEAQIVVDIMRAANTKGIIFPLGFLPLLKDTLDITQEETREIGELIAADIREAHAFHPQFAQINDTIKNIQQGKSDVN